MIFNATVPWMMFMNDNDDDQSLKLALGQPLV